MTDGEIQRLISQTVRQELASILMGKVSSNASQLRSGIQRFGGENEISGLRSVLPYGVSSRAPVGTDCVVMPINHDPTHLNVMGHFDSARPSLDDGEAALYNEFGQLVYLSNGKIQIGTKSSSQNLVLGQVFKSMMDTLLQAIASHTHTGNLGYATSPPVNAADFNAVKASPIDDNSILSAVAFTE